MFVCRCSVLLAAGCSQCVFAVRCSVLFAAAAVCRCSVFAAAALSVAIVIFHTV